MFERGASLDDPRAMVAWAICLEHGIGTDAGTNLYSAHHDSTGTRTSTSASGSGGSGNGDRKQNARGGSGCADPMRAVDLYRRAALHHGDARAMFQLGQVCVGNSAIAPRPVVVCHWLTVTRYFRRKSHL
jgi:hypothetical protein